MDTRTCYNCEYSPEGKIVNHGWRCNNANAIRPDSIRDACWRWTERPSGEEKGYDSNCDIVKRCGNCVELKMHDCKMYCKFHKATVIDASADACCDWEPLSESRIKDAETGPSVESTCTVHVWPEEKPRKYGAYYVDIPRWEDDAIALYDPTIDRWTWPDGGPPIKYDRVFWYDTPIKVAMGI